MLSGADLQSILQLSIPCLCLYQSYHRTIITLPIPLPSTTYLLWDNGNLPQRINASTSRRCSTVRSNPSYFYFQSPTLRATSVSTALYTYKHVPLRYSLVQIISSKKLKLSDKISSSTTYAQNVLGESHLHLAPPPLQSPAHARARSPHTSLRRIFSSRPQSPFRHTMHLRANYITASRSSTDKTIEFVGPQPHQAHCHLHARQQITGPVTLP